jgi:hypothetical protein
MKKDTIKVGGVTVPADLKGKDLLKFLVENKSLLIAEKKNTIKHADAVSVGVDLSSKYVIDKEGKLTKASPDMTPTAGGPETVLCVINTTNWMDSHSDVHIPGLWKKSLKDNNVMLHLQEHEMSFVAVIADDAKGYTQSMTWKELGYSIPGTTEALIFASPLKGRNPFMEDQYRKGFVKNHSVGMRYVIIKLCINEADDEYYKEEYSNWVQYAPMVANIADAEAQGYFWAVLEAKVIEGSAVVKGSNIITPTLGFKSAQPDNSTELTEPVTTTQKNTEDQPKGVDWDKIANINFLNPQT